MRRTLWSSRNRRPARRRLDPAASGLEQCPPLKLIVVHYHLRPGGIRRVIEVAMPDLVKTGRVTQVVLASGEPADSNWSSNFRKLLAPVQVRFHIEPAFGYISENPGPPKRLVQPVRAALRELLPDGTPANCIVWAHNLGLARNPVLGRELMRACEARGIRVLAHHHDWWFDNRWSRWPELRASGFRSLPAVAELLFPAMPGVQHLVINRAEVRRLHRRPGIRAAWLPNPTKPFPQLSPDQLTHARSWLRSVVPNGDAPVWILPARLLRRKNIAEALLLTRWLRPEACLVTTAGISSADEQAYGDRLQSAVAQQHWRVRLGILDRKDPAAPSVAELLAASEVVLLTSLQEGFGLAYVEAAAAGRPLIARMVPNMAADLRLFGFRLPQVYSEIRVDPALFDWQAEVRRQQGLFRTWRAQLPRPCQRWVGTPVMLAAHRKPVPFSRLTLTAQLEIFAHPTEQSWERCAPLNPFLEHWRRQLQTGDLKVAAWPATASQWLGGPAYARRFWSLAKKLGQARSSPRHSLATLEAFMRWKLEPAHLFPLLWAKNT